MKLKHQIAVVAVSTALVGCNPSAPKDGEKQTNSPTVSDQVLEPPKDAPAAMPAKELVVAPTPVPSVEEGKDEFMIVVDKKLKDLDANLGAFAQKAESYKDDAKVQADQTLSMLREQRAKLVDKFEELKKASAGAWKDLKAGFETAMEDMEKAYENAKSKFNPASRDNEVPAGSTSSL